MTEKEKQKEEKNVDDKAQSVCLVDDQIKLNEA